MTKAKDGYSRPRKWSLTPLGWELALHGDGSTRRGGLKLARALVRRIATARGVLSRVWGDLDDLALDAAMLAAARHDPARGAFSTLVFQASRSVLNWRLWHTRSQKRAGKTVSLDAVAPPKAADAGYARVEARDEVERLLRVLPPNYRRAVVLRHGDGLELHEVGALMGFHRERARQLAIMSLEKMRKAAGVA